MIFRAAVTCLLAAFLVGLTAPASAQHPTTPSAAPLSAGHSSFTFSGWNGPSIRVFSYIPEGIDPRTAPIVIVMHGTNRDADRYIAEWEAVAKTHGFIGIAPEFPKRRFATSRQYNLGYIQERGQTELRPREEWTFSAIEPLFDQIVASLGSEQQGYTLYGHSAGSQFVHRFMLMMPEARVNRYIAANAGWYTLPTFAIQYPFGLATTGLGEAELRKALAKDVVMLLGDQDNDPDHSSLNRSEGAMMQGKHRLARGQYFFAFGKEMARRQGWEFGWSLRIVPGIAHSNGGMAVAAARLIPLVPPEPVGPERTGTLRSDSR